MSPTERAALGSRLKQQRAAERERRGHPAARARLAGFYAEVLGLQAAGVEDDFFELGGHSLHATQVISRVRDCFKVELPFSQLFETWTTLADFARRVELLAARPLDQSHQAA